MLQDETEIDAELEACKALADVLGLSAQRFRSDCARQDGCISAAISRSPGLVAAIHRNDRSGHV